ncbi:MAG: DUF285 domain-containing protein [Erysipelotrichaceae bacterium]|nr:DUF285 domain-containing protein [Erysipelotrichaceae bacterium]
MEKIIKLLLMGLLCISLVGCSSGDSSESSDVDADSNTSEMTTNNDNTETDNSETATTNNETSSKTYSTSGKVVTTLSGNVLIELEENDVSVFGSDEWTRSHIKTITFLDSLSYMPSDAYDSWDVSEKDDGSVMAWIVEIEDDEEMYDLYIAGDGGVDANEKSSDMFRYYTNLTSINFNDCFCTSNITSMKNMFVDCNILTGLDLRSFDTSNVTNMSDMFWKCKSLTNLDLTNFDTSNVKYMTSMFNNCKSLTSLDLSSFDTSNVKNMSYMFCNCELLTNLEITINASNLEEFDGMFEDCPLELEDFY